MDLGGNVPPWAVVVEWLWIEVGISVGKHSQCAVIGVSHPVAAVIVNDAFVIFATRVHVETVGLARVNNYRFG